MKMKMKKRKSLGRKSMNTLTRGCPLECTEIGTLSKQKKYTHAHDLDSH